MLLPSSGRPAGRGGLPGPVEEDGAAHLRQLHVRLRLQPGGHHDPLLLITGSSKKIVPLFEIPALNLPGKMASPWLANLP